MYIHIHTYLKRIHPSSTRQTLTHPTSPPVTPHPITSTTYFFGSSVKIPSASNLLLASSKAQV